MNINNHNRFPFSGVGSRADFSWPEGKRIAFYVALNIEHFPYGAPTGIDLDRETKPWSQRSWLWREYGNRVGAWRLADLFDEYGLNIGVIVNAACYSHCPDLVDRYRQRGDELIAHGISNGTKRPIDMAEQEEREMIRQVTDCMHKADGKKPRGWLSPYLTPSERTPDLLVESGYDYVLDWGLCDEQPLWMRAGGSKILSIPYPIELNDQPAIVGRKHTAADYIDMVIDQFDEMLRSSDRHPSVFSLSLHSFIMGQPFRLAHLRRALSHILGKREALWVTTPQDIVDFYRTLPTEQQLHCAV